MSGEILGIGVDVVHVPDFERQLSDGASCFVEKVFTAQERLDAEASSVPTHEHLAGVWAAKEAVVKAVSGARVGSVPLLDSIDMKEIEVLHDPWWRPYVRAHGSLVRVLDHLGAERVLVSISHDGPVAVAVAMAVGHGSGGQHE